MVLTALAIQAFSTYFARKTLTAYKPAPDTYFWCRIEGWFAAKRGGAGGGGIYMGDWQRRILLGCTSCP